ncbi:glycosyltransferase family 4 protein [Patescibacteria group bacterium]|nr:glycosyltransferase family 4 protein [Patescibacteria group bacterium]MBU1722125.1 glycosyltransferase family 4 protein [Patescibacteria group bacterium]MBU1901174.1 glycosyltransferase family 4 protein [Patescibacteria group bacterium]
MKKFNKNLVIIGSNEYCEKNNQYFFRSGLEPQMDDLAQYFTHTYHYSPKSIYTFRGFQFGSHVKVCPFSIKHHENHVELFNRLSEYWGSIKKIHNTHKDAIFMVFFPDSYIGLISVLYLKIKRANFFIRVTSNQLEEMRVRGNKWYRKCLYFFVKPIYYIFVKWLFKKHVQIYTGKKIFYTDKYSYAVHSSNLKISDIKEKQIIEKTKYALYYVGRFDRYKGLIHAIRAFSQITSNVTLHIIGFGNDEDTQQIKNEIDRSSAKENIEFIGQVSYGEELFAYYDKADILLVPAIYETQGKTYLEAMARGVAVVASRTGGIPLIVKHNKNGLLVEPGNEKEIADAVDLLINNSQLRKELIRQGYLVARESTIEKITELTIQAIKPQII